MPRQLLTILVLTNSPDMDDGNFRQAIGKICAKGITVSQDEMKNATLKQRSIGCAYRLLLPAWMTRF
jgi:hypothetical protein